MEITQVRVFPVDEDRLKAFVSVVFDHCFVVSDIKVIQGPDRLFVSMPSRRRRDGTFRDIAHPLNSETRTRLERTILGRYRDALAAAGGVGTTGDAAAAAGPEGAGALSGGAERAFS